jgi:EAL domain-containing protein (putative c-di-GMP-specific phosphodiesterase class I)
LWRFPFDKIKVDRCFMQELDAPGNNAGTVVKAIIALGRELDMRITVEGVETAQQAAFLREVNADQVQGYFFGRPDAGYRRNSQELSEVPSDGTRASRRFLAQDGFSRSGQVILD